MATTASAIDEPIAKALRLLREHLRLDVAFVSQLTEGLRVFRHVDSELAAIEVGRADQAEDSYCHFVAAGTLPQLLRDPQAHPMSRSLPGTASLPVGTHLSVPLVLSDGTVYGTFCGFGGDVLERIDERDLDTVRLLAGVVVGFVDQEEREHRNSTRRREELARVRPGHHLQMVFQPVYELATEAAAGFEALARFRNESQNPAQVFAEAWQLEVGPHLECVAVQAALAAFDTLPADVDLAVNVSPATLATPEFMQLVVSCQPERLVVEITEHAAITDYRHLQSVIGALRKHGVRFAVDDVGTGFSGLDQILRLKPDILKIDGVLVRGIDRSPAKRAMVGHASSVGCTVVAEQLETEDERAVIADLGVTHGQGYLLGKPAPAAHWRPTAWQKRGSPFYAATDAGRDQVVAAVPDVRG